MFTRIFRWQIWGKYYYHCCTITSEFNKAFTDGTYPTSFHFRQNKFPDEPEAGLTYTLVRAYERVDRPEQFDDTIHWRRVLQFCPRPPKKLITDRLDILWQSRYLSSDWTTCISLYSFLRCSYFPVRERERETSPPDQLTCTILGGV